MSEPRPESDAGPMDARIANASTRLADHRARMRERALVAVCAALLSLPLLLLSPRLALVVGIAAGGEALLAAYSYARRRRLVRTLARDREAYTIADVRRYGARMTEPKRRVSLGGSLRSLRLDAAKPRSLFLGDRVERYWPELEAIAEALVSPEIVAEPSSVIACHELLTNGAESPLLNPLISEDELEARLRDIRAGLNLPELQTESTNDELDVDPDPERSPPSGLGEGTRAGRHESRREHRPTKGKRSAGTAEH